MADDDVRAPEPRSGNATPPTSAPSFGGRDLIGLGAFLAGAVIGGLVLGMLLDRWVDSSPLFTLLGIGGGILLGAFGFWARVRRALQG
jgi:Putative F0F1-ATPase subunit Ca2+/Mg2+ transporter